MFVPQAEGLAPGGQAGQIEGANPLWSCPMLIASRTVLQQHREVAAVMATYGMFLSGILVLAWAIS